MRGSHEQRPHYYMAFSSIVADITTATTTAAAKSQPADQYQRQRGATAATVAIVSSIGAAQNAGEQEERYPEDKEREQVLLNQPQAPSHRHRLRQTQQQRPPNSAHPNMMMTGKSRRKRPSIKRPQINTRSNPSVANWFTGTSGSSRKRDLMMSASLFLVACSLSCLFCVQFGAAKTTLEASAINSHPQVEQQAKEANNFHHSHPRYNANNNNYNHRRRHHQQQQPISAADNQHQQSTSQGLMASIVSEHLARPAAPTSRQRHQIEKNEIGDDSAPPETDFARHNHPQHYQHQHKLRRHNTHNNHKLQQKQQQLSIINSDQHNHRQQVPEQLPIVVSSSDNSYVSASPFETATPTTQAPAPAQSSIKAAPKFNKHHHRANYPRHLQRPQQQQQPRPQLTNSNRANSISGSISRGASNSHSRRINHQPIQKSIQKKLIEQAHQGFLGYRPQQRLVRNGGLFRNQMPKLYHREYHDDDDVDLDDDHEQDDEDDRYDEDDDNDCDRDEFDGNDDDDNDNDDDDGNFDDDHHHYHSGYNRTHVRTIQKSRHKDHRDRDVDIDIDIDDDGDFGDGDDDDDDNDDDDDDDDDEGDDNDDDDDDIDEDGYELSDDDVDSFDRYGAQRKMNRRLRFRNRLNIGEDLDKFLQDISMGATTTAAATTTTAITERSQSDSERTFNGFIFDSTDDLASNVVASNVVAVAAEAATATEPKWQPNAVNPGQMMMSSSSSNNNNNNSKPNDESSSSSNSSISSISISSSDRGSNNSVSNIISSSRSNNLFGSSENKIRNQQPASKEDEHDDGMASMKFEGVGLSRVTLHNDGDDLKQQQKQLLGRHELLTVDLKRGRPQQSGLSAGVPHYSNIINGLSSNNHLFKGQRQWHDSHIASISIGQEDFNNYGRGGLNSAIIAIIFGIGATGMLIVIVGHKMKSIRKRIAIRGQRRSLVPDADFLINTIPI